MNFIEFVTQIVPGFIAISSVVIVALVEVVKKLGLTDRYAPLVSIGLGALLGFLFAGYELQSYNVLAGVLAGLGASGLYSGFRTTFKV